MAVKVKIETSDGEQEYIVTAGARTQPASGSLSVTVANPTITVSGLTGAGFVSVLHSTDGADPTAAEDNTGINLKNGSVSLSQVKVGHSLIFVGSNVPA